MSSSEESMKDDVLQQLGNQIKTLQLSQVDAGESNDDTITSNNIHLKGLFDVLDHVLVFGLKTPNHGYWDFVCEFTHPEVQKQINENHDVHSVFDKGRLWIYLAMLDCLLGSYFRMFYENQKLPTKYYNRNAFVRDKERLAVIFTLVAGLDFIKLSPELDFSFIGFSPSNVLESKSNHNSNNIPMSAFHSLQSKATNNGNVDLHLNGNTSHHHNQTEERTGYQDERSCIDDDEVSCQHSDVTVAEQTDGGTGSKLLTAERLSYLDSMEWLEIKGPRLVEGVTGDHEGLSNDDDSFDQFCHNNDHQSADSDNASSDGINNSTLSMIEADDEGLRPDPATVSEVSTARSEVSATVSEALTTVSEPLTETRFELLTTRSEVSTVVSEVSTTISDYEGIVLAGLPWRPGLSDSFPTEVSITKSTLEQLSVQIFQNQTETFHRIVKVFTGFKYGLLHAIYLLFTDRAMYFLRLQACGRYHCENRVPFDDIRHIEIGLNCQSLALTAKAANFCLSTGNESVTRSLISDISSLVVKNLPAPAHLTRLVTSAAVQGETAIKAWLQDVLEYQALHMEILCFSLVHWISFSGPGSDMDVAHYQIIKEGFLDCKSRYLGVLSHWETNYLVLTPRGLYQYTRQGDRTAKFIYRLDTNCGGCRRVSDQEKKFAFEIISDDGSTVIILSSSNEDQASDWILHLCQTVAGSTEFFANKLCPASKTVPCCLVATKQNIVTFHAHNNNEYSFLSTFLVQDITQILVDNEVRMYCILKFESDHEGMWLLSFTTEYELGKFEQAVAEAWKEILQADLQFYIIGEGPCRKKARDFCRYVETILVE